MTPAADVTQTDSDTGPVTLINVFEIDSDKLELFFAEWRKRAEFMAVVEAASRADAGRPPTVAQFPPLLDSLHPHRAKCWIQSSADPHPPSISVC